MMPATLSIVTNAFPAAERGMAIGTWAGVSALALAIGPVLGGFLTEDVSWRAIFFINLPVGVGAVLATLFAVRESRDDTVGREVDYLGVATLTAGLTALVLALIEGNSWGWGSSSIIALFAGSVVMLAAFVLVELRVKAPMVEFRLFASRNFVGSNMVALIVTFAMLAQFFFLALYMQNMLGYSPLQAGVRFLPATLMIVAIAPLAGRLTDRIGARLPIAAGLTLVTVALVWLTTIDASTTYGDLLPSFILMGGWDGAGDVADVDRRDERRRRRQGRDRLRDPVDEPDDRWDPRRGRDRRGLPGGRPLEGRPAAARIGLTAAQRSDIASGLGGGQATAPAGLDHSQAAQVTSAAHDAFVSAFASSMKVAAVVAVRRRRRGGAHSLPARGQAEAEGPPPTPAAELATGEHATT